MEMYDILIVGGGPAGLYASYFAGMRSMSSKIITMQPDLGGQLTALYPEKYIYDIPGFPKILARDFAKYLIDQTLLYNPAIVLGEKIIAMEKLQTDKGKFIKVKTQQGNEHFGKTMLLTNGITATLPKKLDLPDIEKFEGKGIIYIVREVSALKGKKLLIVGGGDSALDWALNLNGIASSITIIHRRDTFRGQEKSVEKLQATPTTILLSHELKEIRGDSHVDSAVIYNNKTKREELLPVDTILFCLGFYTLPGPLKDWGLTLEKNDVVVNARMETNIPGIFAAGDICSYPGKVKMIVTGLGEAAMVVNSIKEYCGIP